MTTLILSLNGMRPNALALLLLAIPASVFVPYFNGFVVLAVGLGVLLRERPPEGGLDKFLRFGPLFYAIPLAVFSGEHFTVAKEIANLIPQWIPAHMFWTYLVGVALLASALSFAAGRVSGLAGTLLGLMFFSFVLLMDLPALVASPRDRFVEALTLRELSFSAGAFALASTKVHRSWRQWMPSVTRYVVGVTMVFYGVKHFLHPQNVLVVPLELATPAWIPLHQLWAYLVGGALVAAGLCMIANFNARLAAAWMGVISFVVVLFFYGPILLASPADIGVAANYFFDTLMMCGTFMLVAAAIPKQVSARAHSGAQDPSSPMSKEDLPIASGQ